MAVRSAAAGAKADVRALIKKLGVKKFCDEYRREVVAGENPIAGHPGQTGDDWAANCRVTDRASSRYLLCLRYTRGVADGLIVAQMLDETASTPQTSVICVPKTVTSEQIVEVGLRYWETANPETRSLGASQLLAEAWLRMWPCSKERRP